MKLYKLFLGDVKFQYRYGFDFLYAFFCVVYILILRLIPTPWNLSIGILLVFSDPSIIGLIFGGAIVHLELSERTFDSLSIAPIKPTEYLLSKLLSLALISLITSLLIGIFVGLITNWFLFIFSVVFGSMLFSMIGFICAFLSHSLNRFFLLIIPIMLLVILPGGIYQFLDLPRWMIIHPGIAIIEMLNSGEVAFSALIVLVLWFIGIFIVTSKIISKKMKSLKEVRR